MRIPSKRTALNISISDDGEIYQDLDLQPGDTIFLICKGMVFGHFRKNGDAVGPTRIIEMCDVEVSRDVQYQECPA